MSWKNVLPDGINVNDLSLDDCRNFKKFHELMESVTTDVKGPQGFRIFHQFMHHLIFYAMLCIDENKFPTLTKCWNDLSPLFLTNEYDCEWLVYSWIFCDFPISPNKPDVFLDHFSIFYLQNVGLPSHVRENFENFISIMKASRLGLYQEVLSTSKTTKYKELFTNNSISAHRGVPYYESGEIFLTRIITYAGDTFSIHDSKSYPPEFKKHVEDMVRNKMHYISSTQNEVDDYEIFMKLSGPYWMSCTHTDPSIPILPPDEYKKYYEIGKQK